MLSPAYSSTSSLKRSISTPGTLFSLKTLSQPEVDHGDRSTAKGKHSGSLSLFRLSNKITPDILAKQLTLIDWSIFSLITRNELKPGQWTGSMKHISSPNVVEFTRRFNNIIFWVIDEILSLKLPKQRADVISFFIKVINHLVELCNLHSSYAIKSALTSAPIHRLEKTWACIGKKDRQTFDKMCDLFSVDSNSHNMRTFMESAIKTPGQIGCIPNLAIFLGDIIHVDSAYPSSAPHLSTYRYDKLESIYTFIEKCQQSNHEHIELNEEIYIYLISLSYIEELEQFREDSNFKISLKLEPEIKAVAQEIKPKSRLAYLRFNSHYDIRSLNDSSQNIQNGSTLELHGSYYNDYLNKSLNEECFQKERHSDFKPGHRKTNSLETNSHLLSNNNHTRPSRLLKVNLIDDSLVGDFYQLTVNQAHCGNWRCDRKPTLEVRKSKTKPTECLQCPAHSSSTQCSFAEESEEPSLTEISFSTLLKPFYTESDLIYKGLISRKTVLKDKKKPSITFWTNYYLALTNDSLLFFATKSYCHIKGMNLRPIKSLALAEWTAYFEQSYKPNTFTLADHSCSNVYKLRAPTEMETKEWVKLIKETTSNMKKLYYV